MLQLPKGELYSLWDLNAHIGPTLAGNSMSITLLRGSCQVSFRECDVDIGDPVAWGGQFESPSHAEFGRESCKQCRTCFVLFGTGMR